MELVNEPLRPLARWSTLSEERDSRIYVGRQCRAGVGTTSRYTNADLGRYAHEGGLITENCILHAS